MDGWMGGWMDRWVGGWMDGWMGGWMDGLVDGCMHERVICKLSPSIAIPSSLLQSVIDYCYILFI